MIDAALMYWMEHAAAAKLGVGVTHQVLRPISLLSQQF